MKERKVPWYSSVAVKSCVIAFIATHIPLLGLVAFLVFFPQVLSRWDVFFVALGLTLAATAFVVCVLWNMFRPLRQAADGLQAYMAEGRLFSVNVGGRDEISRVVQVIVRALAHLDRARAPLLEAGGMAVEQERSGAGTPADPRDWLVLLEVDQWERLDREGRIDELLAVQRGLAAAIESVTGPGDVQLPWGRGRFLAVLSGPASTVRDRLQPVCAALPVPPPGGRYTATAAMVPRGRTGMSWASALQRLENRLFALRLAGAQSQVG